MLHSQSFEVVLIDFGITSKLGESYVAGGTQDFMDNLTREKSKRGERMEITQSKDFYPFAILCVMLLEAYPPFRFNVEESYKEKEVFVRNCSKEQLCCRDEILELMESSS